VPTVVQRVKEGHKRIDDEDSWQWTSFNAVAATYTAAAVKLNAQSLYLQGITGTTTDSK